MEDFPGSMELLQLIKDDSVATLLSKLPQVAKFLPYAGAVLAVANTFLPDENHKAIIQWFEKLSEHTENVKQELVNMIKMESVYLRYGSDIVTIQTAINASLNITKARNDAERNGFINAFKELCSGEKLALAMNNLIAGLTGKDTFQIDILDRLYEYTGGHLPRLKSLVNELIHLLCGGLAVIIRYETLTESETFAKISFDRNYYSRLEDIRKNIQGVFDRCRNEFRDNMLKDMNEILDSNVSNTDAVTNLSSLMSEKYDWLENYCIVCDETTTHMDCFFRGSYVQSFGRNSKFGVVFYREVTVAAIDPGRQQEVKTAIENLHKLCYSASLECDELIGILLAKEIETWGCAVITPMYHFLGTPLVDLYSNFVYRLKLATLQEEGSTSAAVHQMQTIGLFTRTVPYPSHISRIPGFRIYYLVLWK